MNNYSAIPEELKQLNQWVCWRYEDIGASKPTKIPYDAKNGRLASTDDPFTWCSFYKAMAASPNYSGIGFVFSKSDPYTFIDLDNTDGDTVAYDRQQRVYNEFDSYSEISPSGKGLHIIIKGEVPQGRRRSFIEVYSSGRYATMTGNIYNDKPIKGKQFEIMQLWEQMGSGSPAVLTYHGNEKEKIKDVDVIQMALNAANGEKFKTLHEGRWQELYQSQSEADFAYINIIAFYTQNRVQIERIFRYSPLGKRAKAARKDYLTWMIDKSFDRMLPPIDLDGFKTALDNKLAEQQLELKIGNNNDTTLLQNNRNLQNSSTDLSKEVSFEQYVENKKIYEKIQQKENFGNTGLASSLQSNSEMQQMPGNSSGMSGFSPQRPETENNKNFTSKSERVDDQENYRRNQEVRSNLRELPSQTSLQRSKQISVPPGLVGELAQFIYAAAPRQVPEVALAGAIGLLAGIAGRAYNISGTGLNQYVLLIAQTGIGKESLSSGIDRLMNAVRMQVPTANNFIGPSEIASGQALVKYLGKNSQCFVSILGEIGLRLQSMSSVHANSAEISLKRIWLDLYNKSGHGQTFRASIYADAEKNTAVTDAPAFSILGESTPERFYGVLNEEMISEGLLPRFMLIEYNGPRPSFNKNHLQVIPSFKLVDKLASLTANAETLMHGKKVINILQSPEAQKLTDDFDEYATDQINGTNKDVLRQLWNRAHMKVLKLSGLIAVGVNISDPIVMPDYVHWAIEMVQNDIRALTVKFEAGEIGLNSSEVKQSNEIIRVINDFVKKDWGYIEKYCQSKNQKILFDAKVIPYGYLNKRLALVSAFRNDRLGATNALKRALQVLIDADTLREIGKNELSTKYGTTQRAFVVSNLSILNIY